MKLRTVVLASGLLLPATTCAGDRPSAVESSQATPYQGVVVLNDGGVISGAIVHDGQRYLVTAGTREINVASSKVAMVCGTLDEAYEQRRNEITAPTAEAHLELAEWCLQHNMTACAARELAAAQAIDKRHPKLGLIARRLKVAREPRSESAIVKAAGDQATPPVPPRANRNSDGPRLRELASDLPDGAVERFTRKVQPLLVNSCSNAGCHQLDGAQEFQLDRSLLYGMANRRSTTRNLTATLALVNREAPEKSRLLTVPRRPHGEMDEAVFGPHDAELVEQLAEWVTLITYDERRAATETAAQQYATRNAIGAGYIKGANDIADPAIMQAAHLSSQRRRMPSSMSSRPAITLEGNLTAPSAVADTSSDDSPLPGRTPRLQYGAQLQQVGPRDEFDPEIFNRRYHNNGTTK